MLELLSAYKDDPEDADEIRQPYAQLRERSSDWRDEFEALHAQNEAGAFGLPGEFAQRYNELDPGRGEVEARARGGEARSGARRDCGRGGATARGGATCAGSLRACALSRSGEPLGSPRYWFHLSAVTFL